MDINLNLIKMSEVNQLFPDLDILIDANKFAYEDFKRIEEIISKSRKYLERNINFADEISRKFSADFINCCLNDSHHGKVKAETLLVLIDLLNYCSSNEIVKYLSIEGLSVKLIKFAGRNSELLVKVLSALTRLVKEESITKNLKFRFFSFEFIRTFVSIYNDAAFKLRDSTLESCCHSFVVHAFGNRNKGLNFIAQKESLNLVEKNIVDEDSQFIYPLKNKLPLYVCQKLKPTRSILHQKSIFCIFKNNEDVVERYFMHSTLQRSINCGNTLELTFLINFLQKLVYTLDWQAYLESNFLVRIPKIYVHKSLLKTFNQALSGGNKFTQFMILRYYNAILGRSLEIIERSQHFASIKSGPVILDRFVASVVEALPENLKSFCIQFQKSDSKLVCICATNILNSLNKLQGSVNTDINVELSKIIAIRRNDNSMFQQLVCTKILKNLANIFGYIFQLQTNKFKDKYVTTIELFLDILYSSVNLTERHYIEKVLNNIVVRNLALDDHLLFSPVEVLRLAFLGRNKDKRELLLRALKRLSTNRFILADQLRVKSEGYKFNSLLLPAIIDQLKFINNKDDIHLFICQLLRFVSISGVDVSQIIYFELGTSTFQHLFKKEISLIFSGKDYSTIVGSIQKNLGIGNIISSEKRVLDVLVGYGFLRWLVNEVDDSSVDTLLNELCGCCLEIVPNVELQERFTKHFQQEQNRYAFREIFQKSTSCNVAIRRCQLVIILAYICPLDIQNQVLIEDGVLWLYNPSHLCKLNHHFLALVSELIPRFSQSFKETFCRNLLGTHVITNQAIADTWILCFKNAKLHSLQTKDVLAIISSASDSLLSSEQIAETITYLIKYVSDISTIDDFRTIIRIYKLCGSLVRDSIEQHVSESNITEVIIEYCLSQGFQEKIIPQSLCLSLWISSKYNNYLGKLIADNLKTTISLVNVTQDHFILSLSLAASLLQRKVLEFESFAKIFDSEEKFPFKLDKKVPASLQSIGHLLSSSRRRNFFNTLMLKTIKEVTEKENLSAEFQKYLFSAASIPAFLHTAVKYISGTCLNAIFEGILDFKPYDVSCLKFLHALSEELGTMAPHPDFNSKKFLEMLITLAIKMKNGSQKQYYYANGNMFARIIQKLLFSCDKRDFSNTFGGLLKLNDGSCALFDRLLLHLLNRMENESIIGNDRRLTVTIADGYDDVISDEYSITISKEKLQYTLSNYPGNLTKINFDDRSIHYWQYLVNQESAQKDSQLIYNPYFIVPLFTWFQSFESNIKVSTTVSSGFLGNVIMALSCDDSEIFSMAKLSLFRFLYLIRDANIKEISILKLVLVSLCSNLTLTTDALSSSLTSFYAKAAEMSLKPSHQIFPLISQLLLAKINFNLKDLPITATILRPTDGAKAEILFFLEILASGCNKYDDVQLYSRRHIYDMIMTLYDSIYIELEMKVLILNIIERSIRTIKDANFLARRHGIRAWLSISRDQDKELQQKIEDILEQLTGKLTSSLKLPVTKFSGTYVAPTK